MRQPLVATLLLLVACTSEYPPIAAGGRISGTVRYQGSALDAMTRPALRVSAATTFPPVGRPNAMLIASPDDLVAALTGPGLPYELLWLPPHHYKVTAQIVDLDRPTLDYSVLPLGGYPDYCTLPRPGEGLVEVTADTPSRGKNFVIYDRAGTGDVCTHEVCPEPGQAAMRMIVKSSRAPTENDRLRVVVLQSTTEINPTSLRILDGKDFTFPVVVADNHLPPGSYVVADACLDLKKNSGTGKCTEEDLEAAYTPPRPPLAFPADRIVTLSADLDTEQITVVATEEPAALGCPSPP
jgi:hypothetical protein